MTYDKATRDEIDEIVRHELEQAADRGARWYCDDQCPDTVCDTNRGCCPLPARLRAAIMGEK